MMDRILNTMVGHRVGKSKEACVSALIQQASSTSYCDYKRRCPGTRRGRNIRVGFFNATLSESFRLEAYAAE
jgi:hypothetical protein